MSDDKKAKVFRGELTRHQKEQIGEWLAIEKQPRQEQRAFAKTLKHACALSIKMDELSNSSGLSRSMRAALKGSVRELENKITPGHKRYILKRNRHIVEECLKHFQKSGAEIQQTDYKKYACDQPWRGEGKTQQAFGEARLAKNPRHKRNTWAAKKAGVYIISNS